MSLSKLNKNYVIKSKIICKYFISGKCIKGEKCPYLHSQIDKPKDSEIECPMYSIGYCKNGPVCHFAHIKKDKYLEDENLEKKEEKNEEESKKGRNENMFNKAEEDEDATSSTPLAEDFINDSEKDNDNKNVRNKNDTTIINNNNKEQIKENNIINSNIKASNNNEKNDEKIDNIFYHEIPIWYLEHYYDKPISMIFSDLESQNLPEVIALQKKYGLTDLDDVDNNFPMIQPNMNTLNLNFNNFNMNFDLNHNIQNFPISNQIYTNYPDFIDEINYNNYPINKDYIEFIINKDLNIYYYLIKCKNYKQVKKSYESNTIKLPEKLFDKYRYINLFINNI